LEVRLGRKYGAVFRGGTTFLGGAPIVLSFESDPNSRPVALALLSEPARVFSVLAATDGARPPL
jgi:hypothetical protein